MKILALEFSSPRRSVAIGDGERAVCRSLDGPEATNGAFDCIHQMLVEAGIDTGDWFERQLALSFIAIMATFAWEKALGDADELAWWASRVAESGVSPTT